MSTSGATPSATFDECPCSGGTLDKLIQPAILAILARGDLHGYRIAQQLAEMPPFEGQKPDPSGVYRFLRAMEERELVVASWDVSERGPAKRLYRLTARGRACLARWVETLEHYRDAVSALLRAARSAAASSQRRADAKDRTR